MARAMDVTRRVINTTVFVLTVDDNMNQYETHFSLDGKVDDVQTINKEIAKRYGVGKYLHSQYNAGMYGLNYEDLPIVGVSLQPFRRQPWKTTDETIRNEVVSFWLKVEVDKDPDAMAIYATAEGHKEWWNKG